VIGEALSFCLHDRWVSSLGVLCQLAVITLLNVFSFTALGDNGSHFCLAPNSQS
jgi:hypothetical protein